MARNRKRFRLPWSDAVDRIGEARLLAETRSPGQRSDWRSKGVPADVALPLLLHREAGPDGGPVTEPLDPRQIYIEEIIRHLQKQTRGLAVHALPDAPIMVDQLKGHITVWVKMVRAEVKRYTVRGA